MARFYEYTTTAQVTESNITVTTRFGSNIVSDVVVRDGSEDTNLATVLLAHRDAALDAPPIGTSPPCTVTTTGKWVMAFLGDTFVTPGATIRVPSGNSGKLNFRVDPTLATLEYKINSGSPVSITDGLQITLADGEALYILVSGLDEATEASGYVEDDDTGQVVDNYSLFNTTPAP